MAQTKRGTTYPWTITISGIDLTDADWVILSFKPSGLVGIEFDREHMSLSSDGTDTVIVVQMTEAQSVALNTRNIDIDCNWSLDGIRGGTKSFAPVRVTPTLLTRVIGSTEPTDGSVIVRDPTGLKTRVASLDTTALASGTVVDVVGIPVYVEDMTPYSAYGITLSGWYVFARISPYGSTTVTADTTVTGAAGYIATQGAGYVDVAVRFDTTAEAQTVTVNWGNYISTITFTANDLAVRNLDYRTTFYVYDIAPYATWEYALTEDETFVADKYYYTKDGDTYTLAEVTVGETIPADTYYNHSKVTFEGMSRNITYQCNTPIDCPQVYVLPEIEDDIHGAWYEIRLRHTGSYSSTLQVPEGVKVATEHTQAETAGLNMVDLHYTNAGGVKLWRFLNTHSSIPT